MKYYSVTDKEFERYGCVIDIDTAEIIETADRMEMPESGSTYLPSVPDFETLDVYKKIRDEYFGELPTQLGYCYGHSNFLNAMEWHKCSEINIAVTDLVLLLGHVEDLEGGKRLNSDKVKAFLVKKGQAIEVYSTTLHFCPCEVSKDGFGCVVGLLKDTNVPLDGIPDDKRLFRKNKWIIAHEENKGLIERGVVSGIYGENVEVTY